ncbi:TPA: hypothetical protein N0F65_009742, partial [Lagenidium giganteum]
SHVITDLDEVHEDVEYRKQGNLDLYSEDNLKKRVAMQENTYMIALTQRLWQTAIKGGSQKLCYPEYEAFMLRLHRLILPEFDYNGSKRLIQDDWTRDTDGRDHLDYRFFHFSMFELVDLWTDTVDSEDYISLLYCIMHSLMYEFNDKYQLRSLEDIAPVDVLKASKNVTKEEIEKDLKKEVTSDSAQMYRRQILDGDNADKHNDVHTQQPAEEEDEVSSRMKRSGKAL